MHTHTVMFRNLTTQLIQHDSILTTLHKAKDLRRFAEKIVTITKRPLHSQHLVGQLCRYTTVPQVARKALETFPLRFAERNGGYTRIVPVLVPRKGDRARLAYIEYVDADKKPSEEQVEQWKVALKQRNEQLDKRGLVNKKQEGKEAEKEERKQRNEQLRRMMEEQARLQKMELEEE